MFSFQFPLLGFLLCIYEDLKTLAFDLGLFQFPLLGFLLCIPRQRLKCLFQRFLTFNSLYWDFCFASAWTCLGKRQAYPLLSIPFIGIFALHQRFSLA